KIEGPVSQPVTQYRGRLMPLVPVSGSMDNTRATHAVLVFSNDAGGPDRGEDRCMGLVVDEIVDVVEDRLKIELGRTQPGVLGTAVIAGHATDVIDIGHYLTVAFQDWFHGSAGGGGGAARQPRVLVVEDSGFFRNLLIPSLASAGYEVTAATDAGHALRMRDAGAMFDVVVSDIEMPEIDGNEFVRRLRSGGSWAGLPVIALTSRTQPDDIEAGRDAGFTDHVAKFEREALVSSIRQCLANRGPGSTRPAVDIAA
ncbi:MAG TPA: response regulator, partial [Acetobacteraceae bacterium]